MVTNLIKNLALSNRGMEKCLLVSSNHTSCDSQKLKSACIYSTFLMSVFSFMAFHFYFLSSPQRKANLVACHFTNCRVPK